jgi:hypothetical protein
MDESTARALASKFVEFLETNEAVDGLFRSDVFCEFSLPHWRLQTQGIEEVLALRKGSHPDLGTVPRWRCDPTPTGFVLEFEERWQDDAGAWYSREMIRADVVDGAIGLLSVYCTGDWDEATVDRHEREVALLRP